MRPSLLLAAAALLTSACGGVTSPIGPTALDLGRPVAITVEAEAGSGTGVVHNRSNASGGRTVHLAPGERRQWRIPVTTDRTAYSVSITYSNGRWGDREVVTLLIDEAVANAFEVRDAVDDDQGGWNYFMTDRAATVTLDRSARTITVVSDGGDGCLEIDKVTLVPLE